MTLASSLTPCATLPSTARLARALARSIDPVLLARDAGIEPDPWQADVLRSTARQIALLCTRQGGKTTVTALLAVDEALHRSPSLTLIIAPTQRQSGETFRAVKSLLHRVGTEATALVDRETILTLELANGNRIVTLPGSEKTVRGYSAVTLLVLEEGSRILDETYHAVRPMLAVSGGRLVVPSTPFGRRGWFHHEWTEGGPDWHRVKVTAYECPRISRAWLEDERRRIGDWWFRQEYMCEFVETDDQVFGFDAIASARREDILPLFDSPIFRGAA